MAKKDKPEAKKGKAKAPAAKGRGAQRSGARGKGAKGRAAPGGAVLPSVANHPRGGAQVKRARAWAGLLGFVLVAYLSWRANVLVPDLLLRALAGGIVAYLVVWGAAVAVWRHLVLTELRVVREQRLEQRAAAEAGDGSGR